MAIALTFSSLLNDMYFIIDENNIYHRQDMYWLSQVLAIIGLLINAAMIIKCRKSLNRMEKFALASYIIMPVMAVVVQMLIYGYVWVYIASTITITIIYVGMQAQYSKVMKERELQLTRNQIAIMLSQFQPHFLYNALETIQYLCDTNPELAGRTIESFAKYLRGNMDSLDAKTSIPFEKELSHLKFYLNIEKLRFPDVKIVYDIKVAKFSLPALTLQPLVENAIRHGVNKRKEGGTITVATFEVDGKYQIIISDDGVGFDTTAAPNEGRSHIGIKIVRERLIAMRGGSMEIQSEINVGTTIKITLPKEESK